MASKYTAFLHTTGVWVSDSLELERLTGTEMITPVFAGAITGGLMKSARGPRAAALEACIGTVLSTAYWTGGGWVYNVVFGKGGRY